jgi:hypothetical protein
VIKKRNFLFGTGTLRHFIITLRETHQSCKKKRVSQVSFIYEKKPKKRRRRYEEKKVYEKREGKIKFYKFLNVLLTFKR